ncbi:MAG TPA: hypothetical protein VI055_12465 [Rubrobacter sp.]
MTDANELKLLASRQEQAFQEKFGYPAGEVPDIWVGQYVAVNMLGGRGGDRQLAPTRASGMLEAISLDGVVLSVEERVLFIPRESVLQMELYETRGRGSRLRLERETPEPTDPSDPLDPGTIGTE